MNTITACGRTAQIIEADENDHIEKNWVAGRFYEGKMLDTIHAKIGEELKGKTAIDVGAHRGNHTLFFSFVMEMNVIAFEPHVGNFARLKQVVRQNHMDKRVKMNRMHIGAKDFGRMSIRKTGTNSGMVSYRTAAKGEESVVSTNLDNYLSNTEFENVEIALLKIDVEGSEWEVIKGAIATLKKHRPHIIIETKYPGMVNEALGQEAYTTKDVFNHTPTYWLAPVSP